MIMVVMGIGFLLNNPHNQIHGGPTGADMGFFGSRVRFLGGCYVLPARFKRQYTAPYSGRFQLGVQCTILKNRVLINAASLY